LQSALEEGEEDLDAAANAVRVSSVSGARGCRQAGNPTDGACEQNDEASYARRFSLQALCQCTYHND